jgi:hypothetical protein
MKEIVNSLPKALRPKKVSEFEIIGVNEKDAIDILNMTDGFLAFFIMSNDLLSQLSFSIKTRETLLVANYLDEDANSKLYIKSIQNENLLEYIKDNVFYKYENAIVTFLAVDKQSKMREIAKWIIKESEFIETEGNDKKDLLLAKVDYPSIRTRLLLVISSIVESEFGRETKNS